MIIIKRKLDIGNRKLYIVGRNSSTADRNLNIVVFLAVLERVRAQAWLPMRARTPEQPMGAAHLLKHGENSLSRREMPGAMLPSEKPNVLHLLVLRDVLSSLPSSSLTSSVSSGPFARM